MIQHHVLLHNLRKGDTYLGVVHGSPLAHCHVPKLILSGLKHVFVLDSV